MSQDAADLDLVVTRLVQRIALGLSMDELQAETGRWRGRAERETGADALASREIADRLQHAWEWRAEGETIGDRG